MRRSFFRQLSKEDEHELRVWARTHYVPGTRINPLWHPVVRAECRRINKNRKQEHRCSASKDKKEEINESQKSD